MACGQTLSTFTGGTLTLTEADGGGALLTVSGTGTVGDTTDCPAVVSGCNVTATACPSGGGSTIAYTLMTFPSEIDGTASPTIGGAGGCIVTYSLSGRR